MKPATANPAESPCMRALREGRTADFINHAEDELRAGTLPGTLSPGIRQLLAREYARFGLPSVAMEVLADCPAESTEPLQLNELRNCLAMLPVKRPDPRRLQANFLANIAALQSRAQHQQAERIQTSWTNQHHRFEFLFDTQSRTHIRYTEQDGTRQWLPCFADMPASAAARPLPRDIRSMNPGPYLFEGMDTAHWLERIYHETRNSFLDFSCALFVIEPDPAIMAAVFHLRSMATILADPRLFLFTGSTCVQELCDVLRQQLNLPFPRQVYTQRLLPKIDGAYTPVVDIMLQLGNAVSQEAENTWNTVCQTYASKTPADWAQRLQAALSGQGKPLRILAAVSRQTTFLQHSMRDALAALQRMGHHTRLLMEEHNHEIISPRTMHNAIQDFQPDLFFNLDHLRHEFSGLIPPQLPLLCWDQDRLPHIMNATNFQRTTPYDFLVGYSKPLFVASGGNPHQFMYARVPTCPDQFNGPPLTQDERNRYTCDVSYVSHASQTPEQFLHEFQQELNNPTMNPLTEAIFQQLPAMLQRHQSAEWQLVHELMHTAESNTNVTITDPALRDRFMWWFIWRLADRIVRHQALHWVADWAEQTGKTFRLYGRGWDAHPRFARFAHGPAQQGRELLCIYRATRINLQLMPAGFIHQRALDGLAAGGFFLARAARYDDHGPLLHRIAHHMQQSGYSPASATITDPTLINMLSDYLGQPFQPQWFQSAETWEGLRMLTEEVHPQHALPGFDSILFRTPQEWHERAEYFLNDEPHRQQTAAAMRQGVLEHYTYDAAMARFLHGMTSHFQRQNSTPPAQRFSLQPSPVESTRPAVASLM